MHSNVFKSFTPSLFQGSTPDFFISHFSKKISPSVIIRHIKADFTVWQRSAQHREKVREPMQTVDNCYLTTLASLLWDLQWRDLQLARRESSFTEAAWRQIAVSSLLRDSESCCMYGSKIRQREYSRAGTWRRQQSMEEIPKWFQTISKASV